MLILRKINQDEWPLEVGAAVECSDWGPKLQRGLHGLLGGWGDWDLLDGYYWVIIDAIIDDIVMLEGVCKFRRGTIVGICNPDKDDVSAFLQAKLPNLFETITNREAFYWGRDIGDREDMMDRVTDPEWAYRWAMEIGDCDVMRDRVTDSKWAFYWAMDFGDKDVMIDRVTDSEWAYWWAMDIGDHDIMIDRVIEPEWAYHWADDIGNYEVMWSRVKDSFKFSQSWKRVLGTPTTVTGE